MNGRTRQSIGFSGERGVKRKTPPRNGRSMETSAAPCRRGPEPRPPHAAAAPDIAQALSPRAALISMLQREKSRRQVQNPFSFPGSVPAGRAAAHPAQPLKPFTAAMMRSWVSTSR